MNIKKLTKKLKWIALGLLIVSVAISTFDRFTSTKRGTISYSQLLDNAKSGNIESITLREDDNSGRVKTKTPLETLEYKALLEKRDYFLNSPYLTFVERKLKEFNFYPSEEDLEKEKTKYRDRDYIINLDFTMRTAILNKSQEDNNPFAKISINLKETSILEIIKSLVWSLLKTTLFILVLLTAFRYISEGTGILGDYKKNEKEKIDIENSPNISDVAGMNPNLAREISEIIDFIKNPEKYKKANAKCPRGILMSGAPGVGKTMMAKAIAKEAGVDFFQRSASDFTNPYVGMTAKAIKHMFKMARESESGRAIIFIDELDSFGSREKSMNSHDNDAINALLTEMDGFKSDDSVIVIGATNFIERLDPALLRDGRFDRKIEIPLPDQKGREDILKVHTRNKTLAQDVNLAQIAKITIGFSGAELANLVNEATILSIRDERNAISQKDLFEARDKKLMGVPMSNDKMSDETKYGVAIHEAGHAIVIREFMKGQSEVYKVSILPREKSLGVTVSTPVQEVSDHKEVELRNRIAVALGGRASEMVCLGYLSTGASGDLQQATSIAEQLIKQLGLSRKSSLIYVEKDKQYSEHLMKQCEDEVNEIINEELNRTVKLLKSKKHWLEALAKLLIEKNEITGQEMEELLTSLPAEHSSFLGGLPKLPFVSK